MSNEFFAIMAVLVWVILATISIDSKQDRIIELLEKKDEGGEKT